MILLFLIRSDFGVNCLSREFERCCLSGEVLKGSAERPLNFQHLTSLLRLITQFSQQLSYSLTPPHPQPNTHLTTSTTPHSKFLHPQCKNKKEKKMSLY